MKVDQEVNAEKTKYVTILSPELVQNQDINTGNR
jgi:hypothetical protein